MTGAGYSIAGVHQRTGRTQDNYLKILPGSLEGEVRDPLDLAIRLLLAGEYVSNQALDKFAGEARAALISLGLAVTASEGWWCPVAVYPIGDVWVVSERWTKPDLSAVESPADAVYPVTSNTVRFLETLPGMPCDRFLEACGGTGVAALLAAKHYAKESCTADITERSALYAEFGRRLNGLENCRSVVSDVYQGVKRERFDRIAAHPPYVPVLETKNIYSDAGADGQQITQKLVEGAPEFLEPGGRLYCTTTGIDRRQEAYEDCLRRWLGASSAEFDVAVFVRKYQPSMEVALQLAARVSGGQTVVERWMDQFNAWNVENFVHCSFVLQRREQARTVFTTRRDATPRVNWREMEPLLTWETRTVQPGFEAASTELRPRMNEAASLDVTHRLTGGQIQPTSCKLHIEQPFDVRCEVEPWTIFVLSHADGSRTVEELFDLTRGERLLPTGATLAEFAELMSTLISGGFLTAA